jgi:hypothetical protein
LEDPHYGRTPPASSFSRLELGEGERSFSFFPVGVALVCRLPKSAAISVGSPWFHFIISTPVIPSQVIVPLPIHITPIEWVSISVLFLAYFFEQAKK